MRIEPLGDRAVLIRFGDAIDERLHALVVQASHLLLQQPFVGMGEVVPAYGALAVYYGKAEAGAEAGKNSAVWGAPPHLISDADRGSPMPIGDDVSPAFAAVAAHIAGVLEALRVDDELPAPARVVEIPVCYGGEFGEDLALVAAQAGLNENDVIARHAAVLYRVAMLGFSPGFPFLLGLPPELACPRRDSPRRAVAAGSVGIAGNQTGVYPLESPGGWQLIGRTPLVLFDARREPPTLLQPGDGVRFVSISAAEFERQRA